MNFRSQHACGKSLVYLVGNKVDSEQEREVMVDESIGVAKQLDCGFAEASAKNGTNVEHVFGEIVRSSRKIRNEKASHVEISTGERRKSCFTSMF